ncbi:FecR family protein [Pseudoflavitalea sp. X16]|uniref:FecR family protein n=1 Tax=Paraflavitalea devenefica TaxID=2716334 RepID=UPI00141F01F5|nr:FecR family protein [Paraflavitalea devenefica]NII26252.1 FecR family protein [Paraflavitalea devenefica]
MEDAKIIVLMQGYQAGTLSEEEAIAFFQWYSQASLEEFNRIFSQYNGPDALPAYPDMPDEFRMQLEQAIRDHEANEQQARVVPLFRRYRWGWAAAIILLIGVGGYLFYQSRQPDAAAIVNKYQPNDAAPGTTKAVLTLSDGRQVTIDTAQSGQLAVQGKTIVEHDQGAITYNGKGQEKTPKSAQQPLYNTLTTGRGEQSPPLVLSDGTKVWLNALSSIRFPVAFTGNVRQVEITGEAYFEVASALSPVEESKKIAFIVNIVTPSGDGAAVEVVGTQFNINAYPDEIAIKTTLLEGKVKVSLTQPQTTNSQPQTLLPGQQAQIVNNQLSIINNPNIDQTIAWKRGLFDFNRASLQTVLRQLSRWYDIEVKFEGNIPAQTFRGKMTRDLNLSQVIQALQEVDVKFRIEGKTLIVTAPQ